MKAKALMALITAFVLLQLVCNRQVGLAANFSGSYRLPDLADGSTEYRLNVAISQALQDYYAEKSHEMNSYDDFAKFVTPYTLTPIATCLEQIYADDEDFVNGVLMFVHQIPYEVTAPSKYPVETIVENKGDCDLFSFVAASMMKAHDLDVVLLYYEAESHMNVGVNLSDPPSNVRGTVFYVTNANTRYYVAECTGGNWESGWRVGECPDSLKQASAQVVTLENCEQSSPGLVSASLNILSSSSISLSVTPFSLIQGNVAEASGQLFPSLPNKTITIYAKTNGQSWAGMATVTTDSEGKFAYLWVPDAGIQYIRASWSGDDLYAGADSPTQTITTLSVFFVMLLGLVIILVAAGLTVAIMGRRPQQGIEPPEPPAIPS